MCTKLLKVLYTVLFFFFFLTSGEGVKGVDEMLVRLPLIEQIIKDVNLMCMSFSVKHPQTFRES